MKNDLSRLKSQLLTSGLQVKDNPLFQVIDQLIRTIESLNKEVIDITTINNTNVINEGMNSQTIPLIIGEQQGENEYYDNPYPSLGGGLISNIVNNNNNNIINNILLNTEINNDEYFDSPYLSLNSVVAQNAATTATGNIINNILLMNEYIDKEYSDDPYPSLSPNLPDNIGTGTLDLISGQIKFPATQNASTDANTLDDYEEGTWTPIDSSGASLAFTGVAASYTKIGRLVVVRWELRYPTTASGLAAVIGGLPFTSGTSSAGALGFISTAVPMYLWLSSANTIITPLKQAGGANLLNSDCSLAFIWGSAFYFV